MSLNKEQCKTRFFLIDPNHVDLKHYLFMITLDKCNGSCNTFNDISNKICLKRNRRCQCKCFQFDNKKKSITNINKTCIMQM